VYCTGEFLWPPLLAGTKESTAYGTLHSDLYPYRYYGMIYNDLSVHRGVLVTANTWPHVDPKQRRSECLGGDPIRTTCTLCTQWTPSVCWSVFVTGNTSTTSGLTVTLSRDQSIYCVVLQYNVLNELPLCAGACLWRGIPPRPLAWR